MSRYSNEFATSCNRERFVMYLQEFISKRVRCWRPTAWKEYTHCDSFKEDKISEKFYYYLLSAVMLTLVTQRIAVDQVHAYM